MAPVMVEDLGLVQANELCPGDSAQPGPRDRAPRTARANMTPNGT